MINQTSIERESARQSFSTSHPRPVPPPSSSFKLEEHYITIDSRDRDRQMWASSSQFQVKIQPEDTFKGATLWKAYRNVKSLEVVSVSFPNANNVLDEMHLYLVFPEIDGVFDATNYCGTKAIAKLIPDRVIGNFVHVKYTCDDRYPKKRFRGRGVRLDKLTVEFRTVNGDFFDFGADTSPPLACNPLLQTSITLRLVLLTPNTS